MEYLMAILSHFGPRNGELKQNKEKEVFHNTITGLYKNIKQSLGYMFFFL